MIRPNKPLPYDHTPFVFWKRHNLRIGARPMNRGCVEEKIRLSKMAEAAMSKLQSENDTIPCYLDAVKQCEQVCSLCESLGVRMSTSTMSFIQRICGDDGFLATVYILFARIHMAEVNMTSDQIMDLEMFTRDVLNYTYPNPGVVKDQSILEDAFYLFDLKTPLVLINRGDQPEDPADVYA